MSFFKINDGRKRDVYGQRSSRGSGTASGPRRYAHRRQQTFIGLMCLLYLFPVSSTPRPGASGTAIFPFLISSGFWVRRQSPSCQIQWVSIAVGLPGAAAPTWVNIAREISKWLLEWQPQSAPVVAKLRHADCTGKRQKCGSASGISTALSITAWPISRQLVAIILVATGKPVARRNSAITSRPENPCSAPHGSSA